MTEAPTEPPTNDIPVGGLPSADKTLLTHAPLEVAIVEVRYTTTATEVPADVASRARDLLADAIGIDFKSIQPATQGTMQVDFSAQGVAWQGRQTQGWQITSSDGSRNVTLVPGSLLMQSSDYERWSVSVAAPLGVLLELIATDLAPSFVQRIGLRYVDRFQDENCKAVTDWTGKIDDSLVGPIKNHVFGDKVRNAQQSIEVELDGDHRAVLRHGPVLDQTSKSINYLLDLDVFNHASEPFKPEAVLDTARRLNRTALTLFQACVSPEYLRSLQGEES